MPAEVVHGSHAVAVDKPAFVSRSKAEKVLLVLATVIITSDIVGWFLVLSS